VETGQIGDATGSQVFFSFYNTTPAISVVSSLQGCGA